MIFNILILYFNIRLQKLFLKYVYFQTWQHHDVYNKLRLIPQIAVDKKKQIHHIKFKYLLNIKTTNYINIVKVDLSFSSIRYLLYISINL